MLLENKPGDARSTALRIQAAFLCRIIRLLIDPSKLGLISWSVIYTGFHGHYTLPT
jgi:hypothetical protein